MSSRFATSKSDGWTTSWTCGSDAICAACFSATVSDRGVDKQWSLVGLFGPRRNQAPPHRRQLTPGVRPPNYGNVLRRCDVVAKRQLSVGSNLKLELRHQYRHRRSECESPAHALIVKHPEPATTGKAFAVRPSPISVELLRERSYGRILQCHAGNIRTT